MPRPATTADGTTYLRMADPPKRGRSPYEHAEQCRLARFLRRRGVWFHANANGASTTSTEKLKLKREGLSNGVPDLYIIDPRVGPPIAIELKRACGTARDVSAAQRQWLAHLSASGWSTYVSFGAAPIIEELEKNYTLPTRSRRK